MKLRKISLSHVPLWRYQEYITKEDQTQDDLLKCFLNLTSKELKQIPINHIELYLEQIKKLLSKEYELVRIFEMRGKKYGFIPKLDDITYGENADVTKYITEYGSMHKAMAVLYRPIKQKIRNKYLIEEYSGSYKFAEEMKHMPLDIVLGSIVFFYSLTNELLNCIPKYLLKEVKKMDSTQRLNLEKSGQDIQNSMLLVKEILGDLIPSQK